MDDDAAYMSTQIAGADTAFLSNADEFQSFMSKTEKDTGFGNFFFAEMFKWYEDNSKAGKLLTT